MIKTVAGLTEAAMACVRALHSYDLPAIMVIAAQCDAATASWLQEETHEPNKDA